MVLTPQEVEELFAILRNLVKSGHSLLFITHKLKEALSLADRITVVRQGRVVGTRRPEETSEEELAAMMVGRDVVLWVEKAPARPGKPVLTVDNLWVESDQGQPAVRGVSFEVRAGEILGIAGVQGTARRSRWRPSSGCASPMRGGSSSTDQSAGASPRQLAEMGVGYTPKTGSGMG